MRKASFVVFFVSILFAVTSTAQERSRADYWRDVGLSFSLIEDEIADAKCYRDFKTYIACVHGIGAMLGSRSTPLTILPEARVAGNANVGNVVATFGRVKLAQTHQIRGATFMATMRLLRADRDANHQAWVSLYNAQSNSIAFDDIMAWVRSNVLTTVEESLLTANGFNGFLGAYYDPHTRIEPRAEFEESQRPGERTFFGIGVSIRVIDGQIIIDRPMEGSPAIRAGIRARDVITHVDGTAVTGLATDAVTRLVRGENGSTVRLTIRRGTQTLELSIVRGPIVRRNVEFSLISESRKRIGLIKLADFVQGNPHSDIREAIQRLNQMRAEALVFDLRNNGGGRLDHTVRILSHFLGENRRVLQITPLALAQGIQRLFTEDELETNLPMATLINGGSASASELTSGALQDYDRSLIIGQRSFGKGTVQNGRAWPRSPRNVIYFFTTSRYDLPSGRSPQIRGITPDIEAYTNPSPTEEDRFALREEDIYLNALPALGPDYTPDTARTARIDTVKDCMRRTGQAQARFTGGQDDAIPPDYQLLMAQDALVCGE